MEGAFRLFPPRREPELPDFDDSDLALGHEERIVLGNLVFERLGVLPTVGIAVAQDELAGPCVNRDVLRDGDAMDVAIHHHDLLAFVLNSARYFVGRSPPLRFFTDGAAVVIDRQVRNRRGIEC